MTVSGGHGSALGRCVSCPTDEFAARHWGTAPLHSRAADLGGDFTDLLDPAGVDELVSARALRTPFLRMAKDGNVLPAARFTRGGGTGAGIADQAADDKIAATMADGATLVLQALHRSWPPLVEFGSRLAAELGHPVQINAYVTPPQNQGFAPHYDVHDVFVLQVAGRKRWIIHEPVLQSPLDSQPWEGRRAEVAARAAEPPLIDTVLEPGDALYLPRGTIHAASAQHEVSIHLTVGVHPIGRHQLVRHLLELVQEDPHLRASLPMGVDLADPAVLAEHLAATVAALHRRLDAVDTADVARRIGTDLMQRTRPEPIGPLAQLAAADNVNAETLVRLRAGLRTRLDTTVDAAGAQQVTLTHLDRTLTLPAEAADAVKALLTGTPSTPADLPGLDADGRLVLVRRLLREGVVIPAVIPAVIPVVTPAVSPVDPA